jgi:hypothetical protein
VQGERAEKISRTIIKMSPNYNNRTWVRLGKGRRETTNQEADAAASLPVAQCKEADAAASLPEAMRGWDGNPIPTRASSLPA